MAVDPANIGIEMMQKEVTKTLVVVTMITDWK